MSKWGEVRRRTKRVIELHRNSKKQSQLYKANPQTSEVIGATDIALRYTAEAGGLRLNDLTTVTFDSTTYATKAQILLKNETGETRYLTGVSVVGKKITRLSGDEGWVHDDFIDPDSIYRNGELKLEIQNNMIASLDHVNKLADLEWKKRKTPKHEYRADFPGTLIFYEPGNCYTLQIGGVGEREYIDSTVECVSRKFERRANDIGRTIVVFEEILENWKFDSSSVARYQSRGNPTRTHGGYEITVASSIYCDKADIYCDGTADDVEIQKAIDRAASKGGGIVRLTGGTFNVTTTITIPTNVLIIGRGAGTIISSTGTDDAFLFASSAAEGIALESMTITNAETTDSNKYLVNFNGSSKNSVKNCILEFVKSACIKCDGNNNNLIENYGSGGRTTTVYAYGDEVQFNASLTYEISCAKLDSTHFVVAYFDEGNSNYGTAIIGTISNEDEIAYGSEYVFNSATTYYISVSVLDSTHFVVAYCDDGNNGYGTAIIGTVSNGDEIAYGSEYVFNSANTNFVSASTLDSTHFVIAYEDRGNSDYGTAIIGTVSNGDDIAYGSEFVFNSAGTIYIPVSALDSTHFVVAYRDGGNSNYGTTIVGTVSNGDDIAYGSEYVFNSASTDYISVSTLDSTHFIVAYRDVGNSDYGTARVGTIANVDEIDFGSEYVFNSANTNFVSASTLDSTHFVVTYRDLGNSNYGTLIRGRIIGNDIIGSAEYVFLSDTFLYGYVTALQSTSIAIAYNKPTATIGSSRIVIIPQSFADTLYISGDNNIIQGNHITGYSADYEQENAIIVYGNRNVLINNVVNGDVSSSKLIERGITIAEGTGNVVGSNLIQDCSKKGLSVYGVETQVANNRCEDNGSDTDISNTNEDNFYDRGTDTQL